MLYEVHVKNDIKKHSRKVFVAFSGIDFFGWFDFCWFQGKDRPRSQFDFGNCRWFSFLSHND